LPKKVLKAVEVMMPDHHALKYVSGLLQQHSSSVCSDAAFDDVKKCKPHVKKQITLQNADMKHMLDA
jgi:hypothetical protein